MSDKIENVIIIWWWPAWNTAWIYTWRAMLNPILFEWFMAWWIPAWWQLTTTTDIENFPWWPEWILWAELMKKIRQQAINSWTKILTKTIDKINFNKYPFEVFSWNNSFLTKSIIIATWSIAKRLHIKWETTYRQRWVSACAVCDWWLPMFRNKHLIVIWWWDSAMEEANYLTNFASEVSILIRWEELKASKFMQEKIKKNKKIKIIKNTESIELLWKDHILSWIKVKDTKTNKERIIECAWVFYAIWHRPNTEFLKWQVELDENWYIITKAWTTQTSVKWVFACWDVQDKIYKQAITSAWTWCMAWLEVEKFLR